MKSAQLPLQQRGYILALNIAVLALMLVGATYMGQRMSLARDLARAEQERVTAEYDLESARARVFMLITTVPRSLNGLGANANTIALDGRYYRLDKNVVVSFQDARGLVAINAVSLGGFGRERIERLLATYGVDAVEATSMTDTLLDYRDADDLRRINGAEKDDYRAAGLSDQIRNANLMSVGELARVFKWGSNKKIWDKDPITNHISVLQVAGFNPNTADWRELVAMSGISEEVAKRLVKSHRAGEIANIAPLVYAGTLDDPFGPNAFVTLFPSATLVITLRIDGLSWGYRLAVTHTPDVEMSPWRIESVERIELPPLADKADALPRLPDSKLLLDPTAPPAHVQLPPLTSLP